MKTIFKYSIKLEDEFSIMLPSKAEILSVQTQRNIPCIWALIDTDHGQEERKFRLSGTGHNNDDINENDRFIGTFQMFDGEFIGHLFERLD